MMLRAATLGAALATVALAGAYAQARPPVPAPSGRVRIDVNANITSILQNVVSIDNPYGNHLTGYQSRILIWEDDSHSAQELPATQTTFQRPTDPAAVRQWISDMATRAANPTGAELNAMTEAEFQDFMAQRKANAGTRADATQSNIVDGGTDSGSGNLAVPDQLPSLQDAFDLAMQGAPSGDYTASSYDGGIFAVANVLPIYIGYAVVPNGAAMTSLNNQVLTPSDVMVVPSTQITGMPSDVMTVPSTQINVTSTQVNAPSPVMQSLDLQPALCGR